MKKGEEFGHELDGLDEHPSDSHKHREGFFCEHCGDTVKPTFSYGGTAWCKECLKLVKLEEKK